jgi:hypothetical protein
VSVNKGALPRNSDNVHASARSVCKVRCIADVGTSPRWYNALQTFVGYVTVHLSVHHLGGATPFTARVGYSSYSSAEVAWRCSGPHKYCRVSGLHHCNLTDSGSLESVAKCSTIGGATIAAM